MSSWVCNGCHSINAARHETCYSCRLDRDMERPEGQAPGPESWRKALSDPKPIADSNVAYTGVVLRGVAFVVDATIVLGPAAALYLLPIVRGLNETLLVALLIAAAAAYLLVGWGLFGTTVGMRPFGMSIVKAKGGGRLGFERAFVRLVAFAASFALMPVFLIVVTMLIDSRRRALHDHAAGSVVVRPTGGRLVFPARAELPELAAQSSLPQH